MEKTYLVTYKTRKTQIVTGDIVFFSTVNTDVTQSNHSFTSPYNIVYLNADEVISVIQQKEEACKGV